MSQVAEMSCAFQWALRILTHLVGLFILMAVIGGGASLLCKLFTSRDYLHGIGRPKSTDKPADRVTRMAQTLVLVVVGTAIILGGDPFPSQCEHANVLASLKDMAPALARYHIWALVIAVCAVFAASVTAMRQPARDAFALLAFFCAVYGVLAGDMRDNPRMLDTLAPPGLSDTRVGYTIRTDAGEPCTVWVNGVNLGEAPVTMSFLDFLEEVPEARGRPKLKPRQVDTVSHLLFRHFKVWKSNVLQDAAFDPDGYYVRLQRPDGSWIPLNPGTEFAEAEGSRYRKTLDHTVHVSDPIAVTTTEESDQ